MCDTNSNRIVLNGKKLASSDVGRCKNCGKIEWIIFKGSVQCSTCGKRYKWEVDVYPKLATKAQDIIHLINDNF